jgi:cellulose biosynthesis protein BcsQ
MRISSFWLSQLELDIPITQLTDPDNLLEQVPLLREKTKYTIIDCPANASELNRAIVFTLNPEDLLLIPVKPTSVDKVASNPTSRLIFQAHLNGKNFRAATFISMAHRTRAVTKETLDYLQNRQAETGIKAMRSVIYDKASIADALDQTAVVWQMGNRTKAEQKELEKFCEEVLEL